MTVECSICRLKIPKVSKETRCSKGNAVSVKSLGPWSDHGTPTVPPKKTWASVPMRPSLLSVALLIQGALQVINADFWGKAMVKRVEYPLVN